MKFCDTSSTFCKYHLFPMPYTKHFLSFVLFWYPLSMTLLICLLIYSYLMYHLSFFKLICSLRVPIKLLRGRFFKMLMYIITYNLNYPKHSILWMITEIYLQFLCKFNLLPVFSANINFYSTFCIFSASNIYFSLSLLRITFTFLSFAYHFLEVLYQSFHWNLIIFHKIVKRYKSLLLNCVNTQ